MSSRPTRRLGAMLCCLWLQACASVGVLPTAAPPPPPEPLSESEIRAFGELLELQDTDQLRLPLILEHAASEAGTVRAFTALTVARIDDDEGGTVGRSLLSDPDSAVAAASAFALGILEDESSVGALTDLLGASMAAAPTVAAEAVGALGRIGTRDAVGALETFLLATDTADFQTSGPVVERALLAAAGHAEVDPRAFSRWLAAPEAAVRSAAALAVAESRRAGSTALLTSLLGDSDASVRSAVLTALHLAAPGGSIGRESINADFRTLFADSVLSVRVAAIRAAQVLGVGADDDLILDFARSGSPHERLAAIESMGAATSISTGAEQLLRAISLSRAEPPHLRAAAVGSLVRADPAAVDELVERLSSDPSWRVRAALASVVGTVGAPAPDLRRRFLDDPDARVARAALLAAIESARPASLTSIRPILLQLAQARDIHLRATAITALAEIPDPMLFPVLLDAYDAAQQDLQPDALLAAVDAIAAVRGAGIAAPERAFFARFGPSQDDRVRQRVYERFGAAAERYWGLPLPPESPRDRDSYLELVVRWMAPAEPARHRPRVRIETDGGDVTVELLSDQAPLTVANFLTLAAIGFFEGQEVSSVVPGSEVVAGDPRGDLAGGPGYTLRRELTRTIPRAGSVVALPSGDQVHGSRFAISLSPLASQPGDGPVFGRIVDGYPLVERLLPGDTIRSIQLLPSEE